MEDVGPDEISLKTRLVIATAMVLVAVVAAGLLHDPSLHGAFYSLLTLPAFPLGLTMLLPKGSVSSAGDLWAGFTFLIPYAIYTALGGAVLFAKPAAAFLVVMLLLGGVLALNVKGCQVEREHHSWSRLERPARGSLSRRAIQSHMDHRDGPKRKRGSVSFGSGDKHDARFDSICSAPRGCQAHPLHDGRRGVGRLHASWMLRNGDGRADGRGA